MLQLQLSCEIAELNVLAATIWFGKPIKYMYTVGWRSVFLGKLLPDVLVSCGKLRLCSYPAAGL